MEVNITTEWLIVILKYLPVDQLIRLRAVCKEWNYVIVNLVMTELSVIVNDSESPVKQTEFLKLRNSFLSRDRCLCYRNVMAVSNLHRCGMFKNVKVLCFSENIQDTERLEVQSIRCECFINSLESLVHLELKKHKSNLIGSINHEHLKSLSIVHSALEENNLNVNVFCPNLLAFSTNRSNESRHYTPRLQLLICDRFDTWINNLPELRTLIVKQVAPQFSRLLFHLSNLVSLDIYKIDKSSLNELLNDKAALRRDELKVYFGGIPIDTKNEEELFKCKPLTLARVPSKELFGHYLRYGSEMNADLHFLVSLSIFHRHRSMNPKFFQKFKDVKQLHLVQNTPNKLLIPEPEVIEILSHIPCVKELIVDKKSSDLGQTTFFDILPKIVPFLESLSIENSFKLAGLSFTLQLNELKNFRLSGGTRDHLTRLATDFSAANSIYNHSIHNHYYKTDELIVKFIRLV